MALYRQGKAAMDANGVITGTGTKWQSALSLIRTGSTIMFLSSPIQMAVINKVVSDTQINAITTNGAVVPSSDYAILLSDSLTVDGLAQDVAETLRYYQSQETVIAEAVEFFKDFDLNALQELADQVMADAEASATNAAAAAASEGAAKTSETNAKASEVAAETARDQVQHIIDNAGDQSTLVALAQTGEHNGADLVSGVRKVFRVTDYSNGKPTTTLSRNGDGSITVNKGIDNTSAFLAAVADAQSCNGIVHVPAPANGYAYLISQTIYPIVTTGSLWRGASIIGDSKYSTKIVCDCGNAPGVHVKGTSGWPSNVVIDGISLYPATDLVGIGWKIQGVGVFQINNFAAYRFAENLSFSNGDRAGIFTEFVTVSNGWLENGATNMKFRTDGGDASFHGITLRNIVNNNLPGQTGLDIGTGCNIYNATWDQVTFFGASGVRWIVNNGTRNGEESLYFEGNGYVQNNGSWKTRGTWRIQNNNGIINDSSTVPFCCSGYISPITIIDTNLSAVGLNKVSALPVPDNSNPSLTGLVKLSGNNADGIGIIGYDSGAFGSQGLAMLSTSYGDTFKDATLRSLWHLNGISSYRSAFELSYAGNAQLSINSSGRHTGRMGRRTVGSITASASQQIITTDLVLPEMNQTYLLSVHIYSAGGANRHVATFMCAGVTGVVVNCVLIGTHHSDAAIAFPSGSFVVLDGGTLRFAITTTVDVTYDIKALGVGTY